MPNWVTNEITGHPKALAALLNDAGQVDFEHLVPPPANIERGNCSHNMFGQDPAATGDGTVCWYAWNTQNWGTKWNACDSNVTEGKVRFDTAWRHPYPVIKALSERFPEETFEVKYADEDLGSNLRHYTFTGDSITEHEIADKREFAAQLKYGQSYAELEA